ncbi:MAG: DUF4149 domain-containing protein [Nitrospirae bacterium]|jgi:uncharacterized membrane protein|nr:DUF4149 domain-containing protein [Nitrospirota bacterium]
MKNMPAIAYHFLLAMWVGGVAVFTFLVTPAVFRSFDRDMAGRVVGAVFPGYFTFLLAVSLAAAAVYALSSATGASRRTVVAMLLAAIAMAAYLKFSLYPEIVAVKKSVASFVTTPPDSPERARFMRLHAASSVINLLFLADGAVLLVLAAGGRIR